MRCILRQVSRRELDRNGYVVETNAGINGQSFVRRSSRPNNFRPRDIM